MRALKYLGIAIAFVLLLAGGAIAYLANLDPAHHKQFIAEAVKDATGRAMIINGGVQLDASLSPTLLVEDVSLANAPWGSQPNMAQIAVLEIRVGLLALLRGSLDLNLFLLKDATFLLETDKHGRGNWVFGDPETLPTAPEIPDGESLVDLDIGVADIRVEKAKVTYRDGLRGETQVFEIDTLTVTTTSKTEPLNINLVASYQNQPIQLQGMARAVAGSPHSHLFDVDFLATGLGLQATAKGRLSDKSADDVNLDIRAKSSRPLAQGLGLDIPELTNLHATGTVSGDGGIFGLKTLDASVGLPGGEAAASGSIANIFDVEGLDLRVTATFDDLKPLAKYAAVDLPFVEAVTGSARLDDHEGRYRIDDLSANVALSNGEATVSGSVGDLEQFEGVDLSIVAKVPDPRPILDALGYSVPDLGKLVARGRVRSTNAHFRLEGLTGEVGISGGAVTVSGAIADLGTFQGIDLNIGLTAASLNDLSGYAKTILPVVQPVRVSAHVADRSGAYVVKDLKAEVGRTKLMGRGALDLAGARTRVTAELNADVLDLAQLVSDPSRAEAAPTGRRDGFLDSSEALPLDLLRAFDADVTITAREAVLATLIEDQRLVIGRFSLPMTLHAGTLSAKTAGNLAAGALTGTLTVDAAANVPTVTSTIDIRNFSLSTLLSAIVGSKVATGMPSNYELELRSRGHSVSALLEHATGTSLLDAGAGQVTNAMIDAASTDVVFGLFAFLIPKSERDKPMQLECAVARLDIKNGVAFANNSIAMMSDRTRLLAGGTIDLRRQQLDMIARVDARRGITLSVGDLAGDIRITGPLSDPKFGVGVSGIASTAITTGAAVMTAGLSLLAEQAVQLVSGSPDVCAFARGDAPRRSTLEEVVENPLEAIGGKIKGLFGR